MSKLYYDTISEEQLHPYPNAIGIYANHFDILEQKKLNTLERSLTAVRQSELITNISSILDLEIPENLYSFSTYTKIHQQLFSDLYPWAGKIRDFNMSYEGHIFTKADKLTFYGEQVFNNFKTNVSQGFKDYEEFVKQSADFLNLINILHPFPDGNGRTQRNIISLHFNYHGYNFNWNKISSWEIYATLSQSFEGNLDPLQHLLHKHLSKNQKTLNQEGF